MKQRIEKVQFMAKVKCHDILTCLIYNFKSMQQPKLNTSYDKSVLLGVRFYRNRKSYITHITLNTLLAIV